MNEAWPIVVSAGTTLADLNCQGRCENPLYSRYDQNSEQGIQLGQLTSDNVTENSNINATRLSQADPDLNDHIYTHIYLGVSPKKVGAIVAVGSILLLASTISLGIAVSSRESKSNKGKLISLLHQNDSIPGIHSKHLIFNLLTLC